MRDRVAYLHLPKAAGTSFKQAFVGHFEPSDIAPWTCDPILLGGEPRASEIERPILLDGPEALCRFRVVEGHYSLPVLEAAFDPADIACILREPRARLLSHYAFWRSRSEDRHVAWEPYAGSRYALRPLSEFVSLPGIAHQADNLATRLVLGEHPSIPMVDQIAGDDIDALAEEACRRLDRLGFIDVVERGDPVWADFGDWLGIALERQHVNRTDSESGPAIDVDDLLHPATQQLVHDRSAADLLVWYHIAARRGLSTRQATALADTAYAGTLARLAAAHTGRAARDHRDAAETDTTAPSSGVAARSRSLARGAANGVRSGIRTLRRKFG